MNVITGREKAIAINTALIGITGVGGNLILKEDGTAVIYFSEFQAKKLRDWIEKQIWEKKKEKEDVEVKLDNVYFPLVLKYLFPAAALTFLLGVIIGKK